MLIYYVDECGDHSVTPSQENPNELKNGTSEYFVLAGVGVRDTSRRPLAEKLFEIKRRHFGELADELEWGETEIKGRFLFRAARSVASGNLLQAPKGYAALDTIEKVNSLVNEIGLILTTFRPNIFATVVDKKEMLRRKRDFHPVATAYAYMHQRVALAMEDLYAGDASIFVADQQTQHEALFRAGKFEEVRRALTSSLARKPNYDLVLDKPLWVDTALSSWDREIIQLADIAAYSVSELMKRGQVPCEPNYLWSQLQSCMASHFRTGTVLGAGLSAFPSGSKIPDLVEARKTGASS